MKLCEVNELYVGTSPGFKKSHIRQEDNNVYALKFSPYEASARESDWICKAVKLNVIKTWQTWLEQSSR
ncbi:hypothetical protein VCHA43P277_160122 [Vibrio chagasii]|nr:hypothetical protein VCHA34P126_140054 [Vibrio chagasii]CAH6989298.1 hypothetical protein VCHA43P277_160122 [Vibrio chagasii]CAH7037137.1 hypothetical protein VCHA41O247_160123 [Vibrio chagasii]CAH7245596.1 hypothetical protein VCHA50P420_160075 [Vibrio chagasii]